jgi:hypothetical protein
MDMAVVLALISLVGFIGYSLFRGRPPAVENAHPGVKFSVSLSTKPSPSVTPPRGAVKAVGQTGWYLLNPDTNRPMTVAGVDRPTAETLQGLLHRGYQEFSSDYRRELMAFLLRTNVRWGELETYLERACASYRQSLDEQQRTSSEWTQAGERDREDLLTEFRQVAIKALDVRPFADLTVLLEDAPSDAQLDDALLAEYGFEALELYLHSYGEYRVVKVAADSRDRETFERLVELELARRGTAIPIRNILGQWTLKDMNEIAAGIGLSAFRRKAPAIDALTAVPDIQTRLGARMAWRELFQLLPLSEKYRHVDLMVLGRSWRYAREVLELMRSTYVSSGWETHHQANWDQMAGQKPAYWTLSAAPDACPACARAAQVGYRGECVPRTPLHLGCRCTASAHYDQPRSDLTLACNSPSCELLPNSGLSSNKLEEVPPQHPSIRMVTIMGVKRSRSGKARFALPDGYEGTVEEITLHYYAQEGWRGVWAENHLWWMVMALLFWDVYFEDLPGAWDPILQQTGLVADMPRDLFQTEFYTRRAALITARMNRLNDCDLATELTTAYQNHYGTPCRPIERWDEYPLPVLQDVIARSSRKLVLRVLHRLLENFTEHRRGLPDLVLVKDEDGIC